MTSLNEKQKEAVVAEDKRLLVLAGAGSGKTKTLIQKLLFLLSERNTKPSSILAITFTKNATHEMIDRLIRNIIRPIPACTTCGTEIKEFYKFCPTCGAAI